MKPLFATLCCLAFTGMASASITIQGTGKVIYVPDVGYIHVGVLSEGKTAQEAWEKNGEKVRKIFEALKKLGIDPKNVKTVSLDVSPKYYTPHDDKGKALEPVLVGYTASYKLTVTVKKLDDMGPVCDALVENGANRDMRISFGCSDLDKLMDDARARAIADARKRAELYATGAGASLGLVQNISEGNTATPYPMYEYQRQAKASPDAASEPLPIAAGEQELTVHVTVTWGITYLSK
jgi:uncharacterized protein YggE